MKIDHLITQGDIEAVKAILPLVRVKLPTGLIVTGHGSNRKGEFAKISLPELENFSFEISWKTYARCYVTGRPVIL